MANMMNAQNTVNTLAVAEILNLTQHPATAEQCAVVEPSDKDAVKRLLTFEAIPSKADIAERAKELANIAELEGAQSAMIGGAPYLMSPLEAELKSRGIKPLYSFTMREVEEVAAPDGTVTKKSVFRHVGFVEA